MNTSLRHFQPAPTYTTERRWASARFGVIAAAAVAVALFGRDVATFQILLALLAFSLSYATALALLLAKGRVVKAFSAGLILDSTTLAAGWWTVAASLDGSALTAALNLIVFPLVIIGAVRVGRFHSALWAGSMSWVAVLSYPSAGGDVSPIPVALFLLSVSAAVALTLAALASKLTEDERHAEGKLHRFQVMRSLLRRSVALDARTVDGMRPSAGGPR
ncbi:MAG: hypothetical protein V3S98_11060 [Dehalococcoidia bacterium]